MFGKKIVISDPPYTATPLLLKQLKNNQNQTNTTGAQNLKEFNNRAGWLSVFFVFFFVMINQVVTLKPPLPLPLPLPSQLENKKDKCCHLVIWTFTVSTIRIQKLFVIGN